MGPATRDSVQPISELPTEQQSLTDQPGTRVTFDPVNLFVPVMELFLPIGRDETNTMLGIWFDTAGLFHIYVQQAIIPDNIFTQVKIITLRLPVSLGFMISNILIGSFFARSATLAVRAATAGTTIQVQRAVNKILERIRTKALNPEQ